MAEKRIYDPEVARRHSAFTIEPLSEELQTNLAAADWPDGLMERVLAVRPDREQLKSWLETGFPTAEMLEVWVEDQELLLNSTLNARQATWSDEALLVELCANSPEKVGDWQVTVERGPNPYAQFRLQEHPNIIVLEDQRVALGMAAHSVRNSYIDGQQTSLHQMSGWRIRDGFRGMGLSRFLQMAPGPGTSWFGLVTYWFVRSGNASATWIDRVVDDMADRPDGFGLEHSALTASVHYFSNPGQGQRSSRVRPATGPDRRTCIDLINRTHGGLDMFRPYSEEYFDQRMSDPSWGPKPFFYPKVYDADDYRVLEVDGEIVACAGLWDRGRDLREIWVRDEERFVVDPTAIMDFGYAQGHEQSMVELLSHLLSETDQLGRSGLLAPLEYLEDVLAHCDGLDVRTETRALMTTGFSSPDLKVEFEIKRPYVDLAYW